jgi:hypothetical protein
MRLHHRGHEITDRSARRCDDGYRAARPDSQPEREEAGGALIDPDVEPERARDLRCVRGEGERSRSGPRREDDLTHPRFDQGT